MEAVTFGGSGLDRAAHLRGKAVAREGAQAIVLWRGRALMDGDALVRLPLADVSGEIVFLGMEDAGIFACALPDWPGAETAQDPGPGRAGSGRVPHPDMASGTGFADLRAEMAGLSARDAELWATARSLFEWHRSHGFCAACGAASVASQDGWQRDCPTCGRTHFPRVDPVVIMLATHGNDLLLGRSPGWPDGMYSLLAGYVEPGETIEAAARRELFEEAGIRAGAVRYLACQPWAFPSSLMIGCAVDATSRAITCDPAELEDALWISREELAQVLAGLHPRIRQPRRGAIPEYLIRNWLADRIG